MGECFKAIQLGCAVCRIGIYTVWQRLCCGQAHKPRPTFEVICLGLDDAGKSTLLSALAGDEPKELTPTTGFLIKCVLFKNCILNIKEVGGGESVRPFWKHYFAGCEAVVYVVNAAGTEQQLAESLQKLEETTEDSNLNALPFLVVVNGMDQENARSVDEIKTILDLDLILVGRKWFICSGSGKSAKLQDIRSGFDLLNNLLLSNNCDDEQNEEKDTDSHKPQHEMNQI